MTNLIGPIPPLKGDCLTTTNNGQGLNATLANVQDGNGINSSILLSTQAFQFTGAFISHRTAVTVTPYSVLSTDYIVAVTVNAAGVTINLPAPSAQNVGQIFIVQDEVGNAGIHPITVQVTGGANINGSATLVMVNNYCSATFYNNGTNYFMISKQIV